MLLSPHDARRERIAFQQRGRALSALEQALDEAVAKLLPGTEWESNGAVWTVEAAIGSALRVRSGTNVVLRAVGAWLSDPDNKRLPCRTAA